MSYCILIATDGSRSSSKAAHAAIELAQNHPGSKIVGLSLTGPMPSEKAGRTVGIDMVDWELYEHGLAHNRAEQIANMARAAGVPCETFVEHSSCVQEGILQAAARHRCNCILVACQFRYDGNDGRVDRKFTKVLAGANIPVVIYH